MIQYYEFNVDKRIEKMRQKLLKSGKYDYDSINQYIGRVRKQYEPGASKAKWGQRVLKSSGGITAAGVVTQPLMQAAGMGTTVTAMAPLTAVTLPLAATVLGGMGTGYLAGKVVDSGLTGIKRAYERKELRKAILKPKA